MQEVGQLMELIQVRRHNVEVVILLLLFPHFSQECSCFFWTSCQLILISSGLHPFSWGRWQKSWSFLTAYVKASSSTSLGQWLPGVMQSWKFRLYQRQWEFWRRQQWGWAPFNLNNCLILQDMPGCIKWSWADGKPVCDQLDLRTDPLSRAGNSSASTLSVHWIAKVVNNI